MKSIIPFLLLLSSIHTLALDVCKTKYTNMHYAQSRCYEIEIPINGFSNETFILKANFVTKDFETSKSKKTMILIPGGPGESATPLRRALQQRDILNAFWYSLDLNLVMFDPRGTGSSQLNLKTNLLDGKSLSTSLNISDLKVLIDTVSKDEKVTLLAHSAGGATALRYAHQYPERVEKIILISASPNSRDMAISNTNSYKSAMPDIVRQYIESLNKDQNEKKELIKKYNFIEEMMGAQLKARLLSQYESTAFTKKIVTKSFRSPRDFRNIMIVAMNSKKTNRFEEKVNAIYNMIIKVGDRETLNPKGLRLLKFEKDAIPRSKHNDKQWIQRVVMCNEGMLSDELDIPLFYSGRTMNYFCDGFYTKELDSYNSNLNWLNDIEIPTLVIGGELDTQVFITKQENMAKALPQGSFIEIEGAGHTFFNSHPVKFYRSIENFLK